MIEKLKEKVDLILPVRFHRAMKGFKYSPHQTAHALTVRDVSGARHQS